LNKKVVIIDYGMGNIASVQKALDFLNIDNKITNSHNDILDSSAIVLPGVGSFNQGIKNLKDRNLDLLLTDEVLNKKKPFIGICLGMQLIFEKGSEPIECEGLGWIEGEVKKISNENLRIPHLGWNDINVINKNYYQNIHDLNFYFIHSYQAVLKNKSEIDSIVNYGSDIVSSLQKENIFATQFHPEKSQISGLTLMKNFFQKNVKE
jgi:imidazole glycerol-phosphate synthase subunit HisH